MKKANHQANIVRIAETPILTKTETRKAAVKRLLDSDKKKVDQ